MFNVLIFIESSKFIASEVALDLTDLTKGTI